METALMRAARDGCDAEVSALISAGAHLNQVNTEGWTALMYAADKGRGSVIHILLSSGADVHHVDVDGLNGLCLACMYMFYYPNNPNNTATVCHLLAAGADPNAGDGYALRWSAGAGNDTAVIALLRAGADPNRAPFRSTPALMRAALRGHETTVRILLAAGADYNHDDSDGNLTALDAAASEGYETIVLDLIAAGADPDHRTHHHGVSTFGGPAFRGQEAAVLALLAAGADPSVYPFENRCSTIDKWRAGQHPLQLARIAVREIMTDHVVPGVVDIVASYVHRGVGPSTSRT